MDAIKDNHISLLAPGLALYDDPPVTMTISALRKGLKDSAAVLAAGSFIHELYCQTAANIDLASSTIAQLHSDFSAMPPVLRRMAIAAAAMEDADFTPLAAVAGAFAGEVAEYVHGMGCEQVVVNNGGDIAIVWPDFGPPLRLGIISDLKLGKITHRLLLANTDGVNGIATSGFGGRSLSKGVASSVVVFAADPAIADAAATTVANATNCDTPAAARCFAEEINPLTDIAGQRVTLSVSRLTERECDLAIEKGLQRAAELGKAGLLHAALVFVQGCCRCWPDGWLQRLY